MNQRLQKIIWNAWHDIMHERRKTWTTWWPGRVNRRKLQQLIAEHMVKAFEAGADDNKSPLAPATAGGLSAPATLPPGYVAMCPVCEFSSGGHFSECSRKGSPGAEPVEGAPSQTAVNQQAVRQPDSTPPPSGDKQTSRPRSLKPGGDHLPAMQERRCPQCGWWPTCGGWPTNGHSPQCPRNRESPE